MLWDRGYRGRESFPSPRRGFVSEMISEATLQEAISSTHQPLR